MRTSFVDSDGTLSFLLNGDVVMVLKLNHFDGSLANVKCLSGDRIGTCELSLTEMIAFYNDKFKRQFKAARESWER